MRPSALVEMTIREAAAKAGGWYVPNGTVPEEHISDAALPVRDRGRAGTGLCYWIASICCYIYTFMLNFCARGTILR